MTRYSYSNLAPSGVTLVSTINAVATTATVSPSLSGFPTSFPYKVALDRGTATEELVLVTNAAGASVTIQRAYGSTTAKSHSAGGSFEHVIDATDADEANSHVNAETSVHGVTGDLVGTTDVQTLTAKTISSSTALATSTDPALITRRVVSGAAPHIRGLDPTGTSTEFQIGVAGASSFGNTTVGTLGATGALTGTSAAFSGAVTGLSVANAGGTFAAESDGDTTVKDLAATGNVTVAGNATVTGDLTVDDITADDMTVDAVTAGSVTATGRVTGSKSWETVGFSSGGTTYQSSSTTETFATDIETSVSVVSGRRYRVELTFENRAASNTVTFNIRMRNSGSASSPTSGSTMFGEFEFNNLTVGGAGQDTRTIVGYFTAGSTATNVIGVSIVRTTGAGTAQLLAPGTDKTLMITDVGTA